MKYQETLNWLFGLEARGIKFGLSNTSELLERMGYPQRNFRSIHVAGTNGKGSVSALVASVLSMAGYRVGLYTSPHMVDFGERIRVDGVPLSHEDMLRLAEKVRGISDSMASESPEKRMTFFELTTAMAFERFAEMKVDWAVVEVGMGGRLDATNVLEPEVTVITRIGIEHTEFLGATIEEISEEKAGIIKPMTPVVTAARPNAGLEVIEARARRLGSPLRVLDRSLRYHLVSSSLQGTVIEVKGSRLEAPMPGSYQAENMALAYATLMELDDPRITDEVLSQGFRVTRWPGRLEAVSRNPIIVLDATHTGEGAEAVAPEMRTMVGGDIILILGVLDDKDLEVMARQFGRISRIAIATSPKSKRSFPASTVEKALLPYVREVMRVEDVGEALRTALDMAAPDDAVLVTGSLYTLGEARRWLDGRKGR